MQDDIQYCRKDVALANYTIKSHLKQMVKQCLFGDLFHSLSALNTSSECKSNKKIAVLMVKHVTHLQNRLFFTYLVAAI